jgi:hypothetical protein
MSELKEATERDKMMAEIFKIGAETAKLQAEVRWYWLVAMGGTFLAGLVLIGLKFVHQT